MTSAKKLIGCPTALWGEPLVQSLRSTGRFSLEAGSPSANARGLRDGRLSAAFISPIDYAREGSLDRIVRGTAVSSRGSSNAVVLRFREGIRTISTLAADPSSVSDIILARIMLAEEFEVSPSIVPVEHASEMLLRADAALLSGDTIFRETPGPGTSLDLVEMWSEMTDLPDVHGMFCCGEHALSEDEVRSLGSLVSGNPDQRMLPGAEVTAAHGFRPTEAGAVESYLSTFSYELSEDVRDGITEFLTYAYYHGVLPDVPDLHFYSSTDDVASDSLLN